MIILLLAISSAFSAEPTPRPVSPQALEAQKALICWWPEKGTPERVQAIRAKKIALDCPGY